MLIIHQPEVESNHQEKLAVLRFSYFRIETLM